MVSSRGKTSAREILFGAFDQKFELRENNVTVKDINGLNCIDYINNLLSELV